MLLSKLVNLSIPFVLINILVNTIGFTNTFCIFLGLATLYGLHLHYKEECENLQDFLSEEISHTQPQNIIDEIESIIGEEEFADDNALWNVSDNLVNKVEKVVEDVVEDIQEIVEEISPVLQEVADEIIEQVVDQKIENVAPEILETVDEIIEEVVPESIAPVVEEIINESAPVVEEVVEEAVEEIVEEKEEGKWFSIGPWSN